MNEYKRECPQCHKILEYTDGGNFRRAKRNNSVCRNCRKMPQSMKDTLSEMWKGKKKPDYKRRENAPVKWTRNCPECNDIIEYVGKESAYKDAIKKNTCCASCITSKRDVKWMLSRDQVNKMAATKAGYNSYEEYMAALPKFQAYKKDVINLTYRQPLQTLENFDKRGRAGTEGAYQIDHIISIWRGFRENIPVETIGNIKNLRMIPWLQNLKKHARGKN